MSTVNLEDISREELRNLLKRWVLGDVCTGDLVDFAWDFAMIPDDQPDPEEDIYDLQWVLVRLATAFEYPLYRQDAFAFIRFLTVSEFDRTAARNELDEYVDSIDFDERKRKETMPYDPEPPYLSVPDFETETFERWLEE